jgi:UDP-2,3-diacylglucosamine pyrophosphatase LpxH
MEHYGTRWRREHTECIHQIFNLAKKGTEIVYILGNHESQLRRYSGFIHHNFSIVDEYVHIDAKGNKFLCVHGDKYSEYSSGSWKQLIFNKGYEIISPLSFWLERFFKFSLVYFLKNSIRGKNYINQYETDIASYCSKKSSEYSGIIVGHIHNGNIRNFDELTYMCCGDWCDTCSAIVEKNGIYSLYTY